MNIANLNPNSCSERGATIYRNYFVPCNGVLGQTEHNQLNGFEEIEKMLKKNTSDDVLEMQVSFTNVMIPSFVSHSLKRTDMLCFLPTESKKLPTT